MEFCSELSCFQYAIPENLTCQTHAGMADAKQGLERDPNRIFLFDVDGTLTKPRNDVTSEMYTFIQELRKKAFIGIVGGSDLVKQQEQLTHKGSTVIKEWDYVFPENGLVAFKNGQKIAEQSFKTFLGDANLTRLLNFILRYLSDLDIPCKRGTFIELRSGMLNVSPIGRNCSQQERDEFEIFDKANGIRSQMITALRANFADLNLTYSIGGQISFDVFPQGWDKTYCLRFLEQDKFKEIHFFGDKTFQGGNDYEIFESPKTVGHTVNGPDDTRRQVLEVLSRL
jgi:phosphomannomutase